ncbi:BadF/BadG/BcrA/BcrD ATPase family protein [Neobacillus sp. D3-1R]|uniref:BadF/BadG/BcrA/BcrD ATPase family protein n=1 Tax=Neobacillus sp. D3-1R TaxID=3445778 RepID=UPI003F9F2262
MDYLIGVDGGGTKTEAIAYDLNGKDLSSGSSGFGHILIDHDQATANIIEAIRQCTNALDGHCVKIILGLAGSEGGDREKLLNTLQLEFATDISIVNDAVIAHAAMLEGRDGILTIAGTGSICLGKKGEQYLYTGGWGHLLGDEGSGYWIVMEAFKRMIDEEDSGRGLGKLSHKLLKELKMNLAHEIKYFIYTSTKDQIAGLVPFIVQEAENDNVQAKAILQKAGEALGKKAVQLYRKLDYNQKTCVALKGSIFSKIPIVRNTFIDYVQKQIAVEEFMIKDISSTKGAYFLAKKESETRG